MRLQRGKDRRQKWSCVRWAIEGGVGYAAEKGRPFAGELRRLIAEIYVVVAPAIECQ